MSPNQTADTVVTRKAQRKITETVSQDLTLARMIAAFDPFQS